jgi:hypothetical protein
VQFGADYTRYQEEESSRSQETPSRNPSLLHIALSSNSANHQITSQTHQRQRPKHRKKATPNPVFAAKPNRRTCSSYVSPSPILPSCIPPSHVATNQRTTRSNARPTRSASSKQRDFYIVVPSSPIKPGPTINWRQIKAGMHQNAP